MGTVLSRIDLAFGLFQESAELSSREGQRYVADCYWNGRGIDEDKEEAVSWYWKAAENGWRWALSILASLHCQGDQEVESVKRKLCLLNHCIERGCVSCKVVLSKMLLSGDMLGRDTQRGCQLLEETVGAGSTTGMVQLGVYYLQQEDGEKAFNLFERAAKTDMEAYIFVGFCLEHGFGVERNSLKAIASYQTGFCIVENVERYSPAAAFVLSFSCPGLTNLPEHNAKNLFKQVVLDGGQHGLARLGLLLRHGEEPFEDHGVLEDCSASDPLSIRLAHAGLLHRRGQIMEKNVEEAIRLLLLAEKKGSDIAGVEMGTIYAEGDGVQQDDISAAAHFHRATRNGYTTGSSDLAESLLRGGGSAEETEEIIRLAKEASDAGNVDAHLFLARWFAQEGVPGSEIDIDPAEGVRYTRLAADAGDSIAQRSRGVDYLVGHVVQENIDEGLGLIRAAARGGNEVALRDLGIFNVNEDYGQRNLSKGVRYLRKADRKGDIVACFELGKFYCTGNGIRLDASKAVE